MKATSIRELRWRYEQSAEPPEGDTSAVVNIRLPAGLITRLDEFAKTQGLTRSKYLRDLIEVGHREMERLVVIGSGDHEEVVHISEVGGNYYEEKFPEDFHGDDA